MYTLHHAPGHDDEVGLGSDCLEGVGATPRRSSQPHQTERGAKNAAGRRIRAFRQGLVRCLLLLHSSFLVDAACRGLAFANGFFTAKSELRGCDARARLANEWDAFVVTHDSV